MSKIPTTLPVKYKCGHTKPRDLSNISPSLRRSFAKSNFFAQQAGKNKDGMVCPDCFNEQRGKETEQYLRQLMLDAEQFETDYHLPELTGTERQRSSGLVDSARRDRYTVLSELLGDESEFPEYADLILNSAANLTRAGWWATNLGYKERKESDYGQEEFKELIIDGSQQELEYQKHRRDEYVETENPF